MEKQPKTFNQLVSQRHSFYQNGVYFHKRNIFIGTNPMKETNEISFVDLADLYKSLYILDVEEATGNEEEDLIIIHLCTFGGDVYEALGIYDLIKSCKSPIEIRAIGACMSAGTAILQAGDYRYAYPNTTFMLHRGSVEFDGKISMNDLDNEKKECDRLDKVYNKIYLDKMNINLKELNELMKTDSFMDAHAAKKIGLIDDVLTKLTWE